MSQSVSSERRLSPLKWLCLPLRGQRAESAEHTQALEPDWGSGGSQLCHFLAVISLLQGLLTLPVK